MSKNKRKIINDPVYGLVNVPYDLVFDIIETPTFQRLRRINQLGMTNLVYPGALHTRFHHAIGAMHLMQMAVENLRFKGVEISEHEAEAASVAILLHDVGHGPFSHALENSIIEVHHEELSLALMDELNETFGGRLQTAIQIFKNQYPRKFFHQLITGQLDMDRLDYLRRDSFYTGVSEGTVGFDRIIHMLDVYKDELVVEEKGLYSIEKFLLARRLMYWQVYLHKTVIAAESLLINILTRAKYVSQQGLELFATPTLQYFLQQHINTEQFNSNKKYILNKFVKLDDFDVLASIKSWTEAPDKVLSLLCQWMVDRNLPKVILQDSPISSEMLLEKQTQISHKYGVSMQDAAYFVYEGTVSNITYNNEEKGIKILMKNGEVSDLSKVSQQYNIPSVYQTMVKYYMCFKAN